MAGGKAHTSTGRILNDQSGAVRGPVSHTQVSSSEFGFPEAFKGRTGVG